MKLTKQLAALATALTVTNCASFNGGSDADMDRDGVISAHELRLHQNRIKAGNSGMSYEAQRFEHIDDIIKIGEGIINRVRRF